MVADAADVHPRGGRRSGLLLGEVGAVSGALSGDVPAEHAGLLVRDDIRPFALVGRWAGAAALAGGAPVRSPTRA